MRRKAYKKILAWANSEDHPPLIIRGARQVGKSYLVKWLAKNHFKNLIEVNFEKKSELKSIFAIKDAQKIITQLEVVFKASIEVGKTIIFLDEIQFCPEVLSSLRWFAEDLPKIHIVVTGSLLDFALSEFENSMPVGRVTYMYLEPFSYFEFIEALGENQLAKFFENYKLNDEIPESIHVKALSLFKEYIFIGGMPKAIRSYRDKKSLLDVEKIHRDLIESFQNDFNKYRKRVPSERLKKVFDSLTFQLGKKFSYSRVDQEERSLAIKNALELLLLARLGFKVYASHCNGIPLGAEIDEKNFKLYFLDVGLALTHLGFQLTDFKSINDIFIINSGGIAEQFVAQMFRYAESQFRDPRLFFWSREKSGSDAEVDFVIQKGQDILPIEVKAGKSGSLKSLHVMMAEKKLSKAFRFDSNQPSEFTIELSIGSYQLISLPIYLSERLIELVSVIEK